MITFAVTVTYGNRFHLLKQVIGSALAEGISKVIVVDNGSVPQSREQLKAYEQELGNHKIKVIYLDDNYGSASGFKRGLEEAYNDDECEFIWLLDDDNEPQKDSLKVLENFWNALKQDDKDKNVSLISYRKDRQDQQNAIKNGYMIKYDKVKLLKIKLGIEKKKKLIECDVAPYGGLFFNKILINTIGFPNKDFFVYADDHEWTLRFNKKGISIFLIKNSNIKDIDITWGSSNIFTIESDFTVYYTVRNHFYLRNHILKYPFYKFYSFTKIYLQYLFTAGVDSKRFDLIITAMNDAINHKLGKNV